MPVRPADPQRIVTHQLHVVNNDVVGDGSDIERSNAGELVNTPGAGTLPSQRPVRIPADVAFFPDNLQVPLFCHGPNIFGRPNHQRTSFWRMELEWLRARRPELQQQGDQVEHVDVTVLVDVLARVTGRSRRVAEAYQ